MTKIIFTVLISLDIVPIELFDMLEGLVMYKIFFFYLIFTSSDTFVNNVSTIL